MSLFRKKNTLMRFMSSESEEAQLAPFSSGTFHALQEKVSHHLIVSWSISITGAEQASPRTSLPIGVFEMDCSRREAFGDCASANSCMPVTYPFQTVFDSESHAS